MMTGRLADARRAVSAARWMSVMIMVGLAGVSTNTMQGSARRADGLVERRGLVRPARRCRSRRTAPEIDGSGRWCRRRAASYRRCWLRGPREGEERRHDGRHAGIENRGVARRRFRAARSGPRESRRWGARSGNRSDRRVRPLRAGLRPPMMSKARSAASGTGENVSGAAKHGGPRRPEREAGVETARQHRGGRPYAIGNHP